MSVARSIRRAAQRAAAKQSRHAESQIGSSHAATPAQIAANQANAQHSTGPITESGKAIASQNRRTHGLTGKFAILPTESKEEFESLTESLTGEYQPETEIERHYVTQLAQQMWLRDRALQLQSQCFDETTGAIPDGQEKKFALYLRYQTTAERSIDRCVNQLLKLRKEKRQTQIGFESQKARMAAEESKSRLAQARAHCLEIENEVREMMTAPLPNGQPLSPVVLKQMNHRLTEEEKQELTNAA